MPLITSLTSLNPVSRFFIDNFALLCIVLAMIILVVQNYKIRKEESINMMLVISDLLLLSIFVFLESYARENMLIEMATVCSIICYSIRPLCIFFFILLAEPETKNRWYLFAAPLIINLLIYCLALFPFSKQWVFWYTEGENELTFNRGFGLNYVSHILSALFLAYLFFISFKKLKGKHMSHSIYIIICGTFVVLAVTIETIFYDRRVNLLNTIIGISALFYYLFLFSQRTRSDPLTGLFNREVYYSDIKKIENSITAVVELDMNGLKFINDNYGHFAGDNALVTIAKIIENSSKRNMYAYRVGGDEFTVLVANGNVNSVNELVNRIKSELDKTEYFCSIGYAIRQDKNEKIDDLVKKAEQEMYIDKENFYKSNPIYDRRK